MHIISLPSVQHLSAVLSCKNLTVLSAASLNSAAMRCILLSQYSIFQQVPPRTSSCCPQYSIFQQCYHAHNHAVLSSASFIHATTPIISLSAAQQSFISAIMHIISLSRYSIFQQCYHAHNLAVSVQHLSALQPCTSSRCPR